jgi:type IV pilus assembly protein PilW
VTISPVSITDGGTAAGASDTIAIRYGATPMGGIPSQISAMAGTTATVANNLGCRVNDVALLINGTTCAMTTVTAVSGSPTYTSISLQNATSAGVPGGNLSCLGAWNEFVYRVNNGNLERNGVPIVSGIVNIQAQYGISTASSANQIEQWVDATGSTWAAPSVTDRNRIKGVRIAVVARNGQYEKTNVTEVYARGMPLLRPQTSLLQHQPSI